MHTHSSAMMKHVISIMLLFAMVEAVWEVDLNRNGQCDKKWELEEGRSVKFMFKDYTLYRGDRTVSPPDTCIISITTNVLSRPFLRVKFDAIHRNFSNCSTTTVGSSTPTPGFFQPSFKLYDSSTNTNIKPFATHGCRNPIRPWSTYKTTTRFLTIQFDRDVNVDKNYDVEISVQTTSGANSIKSAYGLFQAALIATVMAMLSF